MAEFSTSPRAGFAADIFEQLARAVGVVQATRWLFTACPSLGEACSPLMALKDGRIGEVRAAAISKIRERASS